ncbi:MAG: type II toxin-antitoxin system VapC family toxin [Anaerolineales bacterium]|nr:type II toxin-antitoxin system VapC family toxin [Anaerolineales bacterium]
MKKALTVDASVFVNAFSPDEDGSEASMAFLTRLSKERVPLIQPTLLLPEVAASIARKQDSAELALELEQELKGFLEITWIALDENLADFSSEIAAKYRLRGSDSIYAAVALRFGTELITLDKEQLTRLPKATRVKKPK